MIRRSVGYSAPSSVTQRLYESPLRSQMDYCSPPWAPHCKEKKKAKIIKKNNNIQVTWRQMLRAATRNILHIPDSDYSQRCTALNILPLGYRRKFTDALFWFKCMTGSFKVCTKDFLCNVQPLNCNLRSNKPCPLFKSQRSQTETFKYPISTELYNLWNLLPKEIRTCNTLSSFKYISDSFNYSTKISFMHSI